MTTVWLWLKSVTGLWMMYTVLLCDCVTVVIVLNVTGGDNKRVAVHWHNTSVTDVTWNVWTTPQSSTLLSVKHLRRFVLLTWVTVSACLWHMQCTLPYLTFEKWQLGVSNGHVIDYVTWPRKFKVMTQIYLDANIWKTVQNRFSVLMGHQ